MSGFGLIDFRGILISNPEIGQGDDALVFEPLNVEGALNDAIGAHAPVTLAGSGGQIDSVYIGAELDERLSPATRTFPLFPETEANATTDPVVPVQHVFVTQAGFEVVEPSSKILSELSDALRHGDASAAGEDFTSA